MFDPARLVFIDETSTNTQVPLSCAARILKKVIIRDPSGVGSAWCKRDLTALLALDASKNIDRVDTD